MMISNRHGLRDGHLLKDLCRAGSRVVFVKSTERDASLSAV